MNLLLRDPAFLSVAAAVSGGGGGYDPDAAAYIARVEGASGDNQALETAVKDAINAFVVGCKADGIWNAIKASCILAGARTLNGALQPLVGTAPTNNGFIGIGTDYNRKTGLTGNRSSKYLSSNRAENADPQNNMHISVFAAVPENSAFTTAYISNGAVNNDTSLSEIVCVTTNMVFRSRNVVSSALPGFSPTAPTLCGVSRSNSANFDWRVAGTTQNRAAISLVPTASIYNIFARGGAIPSLYSGATLAFYSIGESLDLALLDARVTTLINAFAAAIP